MSCNFVPNKSICSLSETAQKCTGALQQVNYTSTYTVACKYCGSTNIVKYGKKGAVQYYLCKDCHHTFAGSSTLPGMRTPAEHIATALSLFYDGLSIDAIRCQLQQMYDNYPSDSTV